MDNQGSDNWSKPSIEDFHEQMADDLQENTNNNQQG